MHYVCFLAVEADTHTEAIDAVASFLEPYYESTYDWYVVGGRWSGAVGGADYACAATDRRAFLDAIERGVAARTEEWHRVRQHLIGPDPRIATRSEFSLDTDDDPEATAAWHERVHDGYRTSAEQFSDVLRSISAPTRRGEHGLLPWHLIRLSDRLLDHVTTVSSFDDTVGGTHDPSSVHERIHTAGSRQWIVVVDMHN